MYTDIEGHKYNSYDEYVNSPDLDWDLIYSKLWSGERIPQSQQEKEQFQTFPYITPNRHLDKNFHLMTCIYFLIYHKWLIAVPFPL